jgi:pilus assembly protein Flp/PilA
MIRRITRLFRQDRGATAVEYGLICAMIVLAMIVGMGMFANTSISMWDKVSNKVTRGN